MSPGRELMLFLSFWTPFLPLNEGYLDWRRYLNPEDQHQQAGKHDNPIQDDIIKVIRIIAFGFRVKKDEDGAGDGQEDNIKGRVMIPGKSNAGRKEKQHGNNEEPVETFFAQDGHHANDACFAVVFAVAEVEDHTAGINEKEAAKD